MGKRRTMTKNERLRLVNKQDGMKREEVPLDLVIPKVPFAVETKEGISLCIYENEEKKKGIEGSFGKRYIRKEAARALECLFMRAKESKVMLGAVSGYRSYDRQEELYRQSVNQNGEEYAKRYQARAGYSEHQTGLAMDVSGESNQYELTEFFALTKEGIWLKNHCWKEGFIIRYPKGKEAITGYGFEPWHLRYVGRNEAEVIMRCGLTLEEYVWEKQKGIGKK